jgi:hypothetical protein
MTSARGPALLAAVLALPLAAPADDSPPFRPQAVNVLGTGQAGVPITFTRVFTQTAGEPAIAVIHEHFVNLVPNWVMFARNTLTPRPFPVAYVDITWADQILRLTCFLDRAESDLLRRRFHVTMKTTKGTRGATPVGTVAAVSIGRAFQQDGKWVIEADITWTPGILPEVTPTSFTIAHHLVPGLWKTGQPGVVVAGHTFTSIPPPDGSDPVVYSVQQEIQVQ